MAVLGTAGHVDHGKTTLVRALTGIDTDRLPDEKRRGITIELGFAPLTVVDPLGVRRVLAVVDVPGHERFVGTMVAGAQGIDAALLVVAADVGTMQQTYEHVQILEALGVTRTVVALTRADLADHEMRGLVREEVEDMLARTPWPGAPVVAVSARSGEGLDALMAAIEEATRSLDNAARRALPVRLPVDRAFVPRGQGVVVTGTLVAGRIAVGSELELLPGLPPFWIPRRVRVRGMHAHGKSIDAAEAGERVALGLAGIELAEVHRGAVLATPGSLLSTRAFDAVLSRPTGGRAFGRRAQLTIHAGTDAVGARLVPLVDTELGESEPPTTVPTLVPTESPIERPKRRKATLANGEGGARMFVRVVTSRPVVVAAGDRLVVRGDAPLASVGTTLGGLEVLRSRPGRMVGGRAAYAKLLGALLGAGDEQRARFEIGLAGLAGLSPGALGPRLAARAVGSALARGLEPLQVSGRGPEERPVWVAPEARTHCARRMHAMLRRFHSDEPDAEGAPWATVIAAVPSNAAPGLALATLESEITRGLLARAGDRVRLASFTPHAGADNPIARALLTLLEQGGLSPPLIPEVATRLQIPVAQARALAGMLAGKGRVVHVQGDLWFATPAIEALRERLVSQLRNRGAISTGEFKALVGASRKFTVPLAEWFDAQRVTLRVGDVRKLRR